MTETQLPRGWVSAPFSAVFELQNGFAFKSSSYVDVGAFVVRIGNVQDEGVSLHNPAYIDFSEHDLSSFKLFPEDILISLTGNVGRVAIIKGDQLPAVLNQRVARVVYNAIEKCYVYYALRTKNTFEAILETAKGAAQLNISTKDILSIHFPVPPLAEQKVITDKLDSLLAQVDNTKARLERIPEILKSFRQSVLAAAVSGKLTEEWRDGLLNPQCLESIKQDMKSNRFNAWLIEQEKACSKTGRFFDKEKLSAKYDEPSDEYQDEYNLTVISNIPGSWLVTNLDNVSIAVTGKTPSTTDEFNWGGEIPFITPTQILPAGAVEMPDRFVTEQGAQKIQLLPKGAVLIVCIGTIGKVGLLDTDAAFNQQINALIPTNSILSKFLFYWAKTLHSWLNKTSSAVVNAAIINKSRLCAAPCPLPSIAEQTEIVRRVEELFAFADRIEQAAQAALSRVNNLTQSILAKAFRGELTADWRAANPDLITGDNSAEALLAKIKAERAKLSKNTKAKA